MGLHLNTLAGLAVALIAGTSLATAFAQDNIDPAAAIAERQELMSSIGKSMRGAGNLTGDAAVEQAQAYIDGFTKLHTLFPAGSETGGDTKAAPAIWTDMEGFTAVSDKAVAQAELVLAAAQSGDQAAYATALRGLGPVCGECHQTYRLK